MRRARLLIASWIVIAAVLTSAVLADGTAGNRAGTLRADAHSVPRFSKVAVLFLENHGYRQIIGSGQAPF